MTYEAKVLEADEELYPVVGNRRFYSGFYDRAAGHGQPTGSGPGWAEAQRKFAERQKQWALPGVWRSSSNPQYYRNKGTQRDIDYAIKEWI